MSSTIHAHKHSNKQRNITVTVEPENIRNISSSTEWQELEFVVDSGVSETVIGE